MDTLWKSVLGELELEPSISAANFKTWLAETELIFIDDQRATIGVKNAFHVNQLRKKYCDIIQKTLEKNGVNPKEIDFKVQTVNKTTKISREAFEKLAKESGKSADEVTSLMTSFDKVITASKVPMTVSGQIASYGANLGKSTWKSVINPPK